jgi:hypothetical protein
MNTPKNAGLATARRKRMNFGPAHLPRKSKFALHVALLFVASAAQAQSHVDSKYRCAVLGDTSLCERAPDLPAVRVESRLELGPRALYLKHLGASTHAAIAQARLLGEVPSCRVVRITTRQLSSAEKLDRVNGRGVGSASVVETLSLNPATDEKC